MHMVKDMVQAMETWSQILSLARWKQRPVPQGGAVRQRRDLSIHFLGDQGIVLDPVAQKVYRLDQVSTLVWCLLDEGLTVGAIKTRLQRDHGLPLDDADGSVDIALAAWDRQGLLDAPHRPSVNGRAANPAPVRRPEPALPIPAIGEACERLSLRVAGLHIILDVHTPRPLDHLRAVFDHLAVEHDGRDALSCSLVPFRRGYAVTAGRRTLMRCPAEAEVVPMVKTALSMLAIETVDAPGALHAAALAIDGQAVVLPAGGGAGKSTLAAALVHNGFDLAGDDTVFLLADGRTIQPMPLAICLKEKAWAAVAGCVPDIDRLPGHRRGDGKTVRYVVPRRNGAFAFATDPLPIARLVFPCFQPRSGVAVHRLSGGEALQRLLPQFFPKEQRFDRDTLDCLVTLLEHVDACAITYGDLAGAVDAVKRAIS